MAAYPTDAVARTAVGVARARAIESNRADRLFSDPLAAELVAAAGLPMMSRRAGLEAWVAVRTRFLDDVVECEARHGCRQFVLLGAGLDTRPLRLNLPSEVRWFDVDRQEVLAFKAGVLARLGVEPKVGYTAVHGDLRRDWISDVLRAGLDPDGCTTWIAEGLLVYLSDDDNDRLAATLSASSPVGSRLAATLPSLTARTRGTPVTRLWRSSGPADPIAWCIGFGWAADVYVPEGRSYRPWTPATPRNGSALLTAVRL